MPDVEVGRQLTGLDRVRDPRREWLRPGVGAVPDPPGQPDDDPLARQWQIIAWHPLRALNAINVRVLGSDLLTVHVQLNKINL